MTREENVKEIKNRVERACDHIKDYQPYLTLGSAKLLLSEYERLKRTEEFTTKNIFFLQEKLDESKARIKGLEIELGEAQQWIDSDPNWKAKYMDFYMSLLGLNQRLYKRIKATDEKVKGLKEGIEKYREEWDFRDDDLLYKLIEKDE